LVNCAFSSEVKVEQTASVEKVSAGRMKFLVGGLLIVAAIVYLIISSTQASAQYFMTIVNWNRRERQFRQRSAHFRCGIRESIQYDPESLELSFMIADIPGDNADIELRRTGSSPHEAVIDPNRPRLQIVYSGPKPDLLRNEAQAIVTGKIGEDGIFYANELLLKCPTKYEESVPEQAGS
jgi:cytochrome c-type biogenesis protein CcmE